MKFNNLHLQSFPNSHFIPGSAKATQVMLILHGRGDDLKSFLDLPEEFSQVDCHYLLINAPRAYLDGYSWYGLEPHQKTGIESNRQRLLILLEELKRFGFVEKNIIFFGFSQGALMSLDFALFSGKKLAAVIAVSGYNYLPSSWETRIRSESKSIPILVTHGVYDEMLPMEKTLVQIDYLQRKGLKIQWQDFAKDHDIDLEDEIPFIQRWIRKNIS